MNVALPYRWRPRPYQERAWNIFRQGCRKSVHIIHRRGGKDYLALNRTAVSAIERIGLYWHCLPRYNQARKVAWENVTNDGRNYRSVFPGWDDPGNFTNPDKPCIVEKSNDHEMRLNIAGGSIWQLVGSDKPDSLRGPNPVGMAYSEWSFMNPIAREIVDPIMAANRGWEMYITTPNGQNHGWRVLQEAKSDPFHPIENPDGWFWEVLTIDDTRDESGHPIVTQKIIDDYRRKGRSEEWIQREFYCSFNTAVEGAYYGKQMMSIQDEGRICSVPWIPHLMVHTAWDIGKRDATAIWFYQLVGDDVNVIDYYEASGEALPHYAKVIKEKPYVYGDFIGPHDMDQGDWGSGKTRREAARGYGMRFKVLKRFGIAEGIEAVRAVLYRCRFDEKKCARGLQTLREYHKKKLEGVFGPNGEELFSDEPEHDWTSHGADGFRYLALGYKGDPDKRKDGRPTHAVQKFKHFSH